MLKNVYWRRKWLNTSKWCNKYAKHQNESIRRLGATGSFSELGMATIRSLYLEKVFRWSRKRTGFGSGLPIRSTFEIWGWMSLCCGRTDLCTVFEGVWPFQGWVMEPSLWYGDQREVIPKGGKQLSRYRNCLGRKDPVVLFQQRRINLCPCSCNTSYVQRCCLAHSGLCGVASFHLPPFHTLTPYIPRLGILKTHFSVPKITILHTSPSGIWLCLAVL